MIGHCPGGKAVHGLQYRYVDVIAVGESGGHRTEIRVSPNDHDGTGCGGIEMTFDGCGLFAEAPRYPWVYARGHADGQRDSEPLSAGLRDC